MIYLLKYITTNGEYKPFESTTESLDLNGVVLGKDTNVVTVSGVNSLAEVSGNIGDQINTILMDYAVEERYEAVSGQTVFNTGFNFSPSNSRRDVVVHKNGVKVYLSLSGDVSGTVSGGDYKKNSQNEIEFLYALQDGDRVTVREERTGGGSIDLQNIPVDITPLTNASKSVGTSIKAWSAIYLKDTTNTDIYRLEITGGEINAIKVT